MDVIAEGLETMEQLARLSAMEWEHGQGDLFFKPVDGKPAKHAEDEETRHKLCERRGGHRTRILRFQPALCYEPGDPGPRSNGLAERMPFNVSE